MHEEIAGLFDSFPDIGKIRSNSGETDHGRFAEKIVTGNGAAWPPATSEIGGAHRSADSETVALNATF